MKKIITLSLAALMALIEALPSFTVVAISATALIPIETQALPQDRMAGRQGARDSRQDGRQTSRERRRGCYGLPGGAVPFAYRGFNYYRLGGRYLYPYMYGGRTVYIDVDVSGGYPVSPPAAGSIDIDIY